KQEKESPRLVREALRQATRPGRRLESRLLHCRTSSATPAGRRPRWEKLLLRGGGRLRLLFPSARGGFLRLHRGGGFQRLEPGVEKRRPRLGQARGAITVSAFLDIVPAGVVPLAGKSALVAQQARGVGIVVGEFLERAQGPGHRLLGLVASLADCSGVLLELGAIGTPQTAGARLAVGRLKDAGGDLRRDEDRAVENVECEGTGRHADLIALEPVGTLLARRLDRLLADDVDDAALRGVGDALAGQSQLVDLQRLAGAGDLKQPRLAVQPQRAPVDRGDVGRRRGLALGRFLRLRSRACLLRLGCSRWRAGGCGRSGAWRGLLGAGWRGEKNEATDNERKAPIHRKSVEGPATKGKAFVRAAPLSR